MQNPHCCLYVSPLPMVGIEFEQSTTFSSHYKMKRWILLAFVWLVGCNSYVDPDWYNKPAFTEHLGSLYAYPSVAVTTSKE
jgi:hypothetical protein